MAGSEAARASSKAVRRVPPTQGAVSRLPLPLPFSPARAGCARFMVRRDAQAMLLALWGAGRGGGERESPRPRLRLSLPLSCWFLRAPTHVIAASASDALENDTHDSAAPLAESS